MAEIELSASGISETPSSADFQKTYIHLRTVLDGLEISALRYVLNDLNPAVRTRRAEEITALLMPIVTDLQQRITTSDGNDPSFCPNGFYYCDGICVPYQCL